MSRYFPGQSGNPGGRPKSVKGALEKFRDEKDLDELRKALKTIALDANQETRDRIAAIKEYHDRAYGKAMQPIETTVTIEDLHERVSEIIAGVDGEDDAGSVEQAH